MASNKVLDIIIEAHDRASNQIKSVRSQVEKLNQVGANMRDVGRNFMGVGLAVGAGMGYAIKTTGDFEQAVANAGSVMGRSAGDWKDIEKVAREYGKTTTYTATESASAIQLLAQYGYDLGDAQKHMANTTKLATAQQYDLGLTTDVVVSTMKNFEKQGVSSARIADVFAKASNISSANMDKFRYSLKYTSPVANSLGISLEDMTAQLALLYDAGLPAETAGSALRMAYSRLLSPTKSATEALAKYGISLDQVNPKTNKMADIMDTLTKAGVDTNDAFEIFGVETAPAMLAMMNKGGDAIRKYEKELSSASGTVGKMYETQMSTYNNQMKLLKSQLQESAIQMGMALLPVMKQIVGAISKVVDWFNGLGETTKKYTAYALVAFAGFSLLAGMILFFGGAMLTAMASMRMFTTYLGMFKALPKVASIISKFTYVWTILKMVLYNVGKAFIWLGRAMLTTPIGLIITAIIVAIFLLYKAWTSNWGDIQGKTKAVWSWMKSAGSALVDWFKGAWDSAITAFKNFGKWIATTSTEIWASISGFFTGVYNDAVAWASSVPTMISDAWNSLVSWFTSFGQSLKSTIYNFLLGILMDTGQTQEQAKQTLQDAWTNIKAFFSQIWAGIRYVFYDAWVQLGQTVSSGASTAYNFVSHYFTLAWNFIVNIWNQVVTFLSTIWNVVYTIISTYLTNVYNTWMERWNLVLSILKVIWNIIVTWVQTQWNRLMAIVNIGLTILQSVWSAIWTSISNTAKFIWSVITTIVKTGISLVMSVVRGYLNVVKAIWNSVWSGIKAFASSIWASIKSVVSSGIAIVKNIIALAINLIAGNWSQAWNNIKNIIKNAWSIIQTIMSAGLRAIISAIRSFFGTARDSGAKLMEAFAQGIKNAVGKVTGAVKNVLGKARRFFGFSDAKEGPFSNITHSGYATMSAFAKGATSAKNLLARSVGGTLDSALSGASVGSLAIGGMSGSGLGVRRTNTQEQQTSPNINITINGGDGQDPKEIADAVMREINRQMKR